MEITLAKALKLKNKITKEITTLKNRVQQNNCFRSNQKVSFDSRKELDNLLKKSEELTQLKSKISTANAPIWDKIFRIAELKGIVQTLNTLNTTEREEVTYKPNGEEVPVSIKTSINEIEKTRFIEKIEGDIEDFQDQIDTFNATTKITV